MEWKTYLPNNNFKLVAESYNLLAENEITKLLVD